MQRPEWSELAFNHLEAHLPILNRIVLMGRLTQDPELRYTNSGTAVSSFTLAVDRARSNQNGDRETDFITIVIWQKQAELCAQYLHKGRLAAVDSRFGVTTIAKDKRYELPRW